MLPRPHDPTRVDFDSDDSLVPSGLSLEEYFLIYRTLVRIKARVLSGTPSGRVIDRALDEAMNGETPATKEQA